MKIVFGVIFLFSLPALAQLGSNTQNPPSVKWSQIKSPHFRIIYPRGYDSVSNHLLNTLETVYTPDSKTLGREPRPISLVLQTQTTVSNGFVTLMPRHSEFYITPPQDANFLGQNRWLDLLATHEFRHVVQNDKALTGFSKVLFYTFGYNALGFINLGIPDWFVEGDAVCSETALTPGGRGRIPEFNLLFRTQLLDRKKPFSYAKAVAGSFRDYIPNWYVLGYHLTNYARRTYGADIWAKTLDRYYRFPLYPFSFSNSLRKTTNGRIETLYQQATNDFKNQWKEQQAQLIPTAVNNPGITNVKVYTDYCMPQFLADGRIVALKSGLATIPTFVLLDGKAEENAHETGYLNESATLSAGDNILVWVEQRFDPRWGMRDYTVIKTLNFQTRQRQQLSFRSRYFAPTISPDGSSIIVVETDTQGKSHLVQLNARDGHIIHEYSNPDGAFYQQPRYASDGRRIVVIKQKGSLKTIALLDTETGNQQELFPYVSENIAQPLLTGQWVLYNSPFSGIDNIYAYQLETNKHFQVTRRPYGACQAALSPDGKTLAFQDFTPLGYRIATIPFQPETWLERQDSTTNIVRPFQYLVQQEQNSDLLNQVPNQTYTPKNYSKANLFKIYNWGPTFSSTGTDLSIGIESQNLTSTMFASAGYGYNASEQRGNWYGNLSYYGLYPVIDIGVESAARQTSILLNDTLRTSNWRQNELNVGLRLPLVFTHSKYREGMSLSVQANLIQTQGYSLSYRYVGEPGRNNLAATTVSFAYSRLLRQATRDVQPRWGQYLSLYARNTPFGGELTGNLFAAQTRLYFPGIAKHHSVRVFAGAQFQGTTSNYTFGSPMFFPRGYSYISTPTLYTGTVQYQLPIAYPDWNLGRLLYIQRIKLNGFMDMGYAANTHASRTYQSQGLDVLFNFTVLRMRQTLEAGARFIWTKEGSFQPQFLVVDIGF
ncbi:MAG: hypothetical protein QM669_05660 [Siphonobacter sp.]